MQRYKKNLKYLRGWLFFCIFAVVREQEIKQAVEVLRRGGTLLYPTDTIWGIGCDARNSTAVEKIYRIKERDHAKSMLVLIAEGQWQPPCDAGQRPTTYILPRNIWQEILGDGIARNLPAADHTLGVRVARHEFCQEVIRRLGAPIVSTSANLSGRPSPMQYEEIEESLRERVDYCVAPLPEFISNEKQGSRIVKIEPDGSLTVLRP